MQQNPNKSGQTQRAKIAMFKLAFDEEGKRKLIEKLEKRFGSGKSHLLSSECKLE
jgi:hypothetical protein